MNHFYLFFTYIKWKKKKKIVKKNVVCEGMKVKERKEKGERERIKKKRCGVCFCEKKKNQISLIIKKILYIYFVNFIILFLVVYMTRITYHIK